MGYRGRRVFRIHPVAIWIVVASIALFATGAVYMFLYGKSPFTAWGLAGMAVLGVVGLVDWLVTRVELLDDEIVVRTLWSRRSYPRAEIESVYEAKGVPSALVLTGDRIVKMPDIGPSFGNSVRAWLKSNPGSPRPL